MKRFLSMSALSLGVATAANAMTLGVHGVGQVLIYPYYTVNGGNGTLISIVNTNEEGKALKVRFREALNGRVVADFNLYLSGWDAWVGQVFDTSADGAGVAAIATNDNSCTVPAFSAFGGGQGPQSLLFSSAAYSAANADGGPQTQARTHEGYFEVIEMGVVTNATKNSLTALSHISGLPKNCAQLTAAWGVQGYWTAAPATDLNPPTGGLYGSEAVLNIAQGTMYTANAEAIDGFSTVAQHSAPGSASPDLSTASKTAGIVSAFFPVRGDMIRADYAKSEDAVSALFMADGLFNEYVVDPAVAATSDWVVTLPTKLFYTDPQLLGASVQALPPFDVPFGAVEGGTSCSPINPEIFTREEDALNRACGFTVCPQTRPSFALCYDTNVLTLGSERSLFGTHLTHTGADYTSVVDVPSSFDSGQLHIDLRTDVDGGSKVDRILTSTNGPLLHGLPAFGFLAVQYVNGNVTPGVLANYSGSFPHRSHVTCTNRTNPADACQ